MRGRNLAISDIADAIAYNVTKPSAGWIDIIFCYVQKVALHQMRSVFVHLPASKYLTHTGNWI